MKPLLMRHSEPVNESFKVWRNGNPYKHIPWHFHPEYEITYIFKGKGVLFVDDQMIDYNDDEIIIIGSNLPHEWRSDIIENPDQYSESMSIHFNKHFLGEDFYNLHEGSLIKDLLQQSKRGIKIEDNATKDVLKQNIQMLIESEGMVKIYKLLEILDIISKSKHLRYLSSNNFADSIEQSQDNRIKQIFDYVMNNFTRSISISETAALVNMTSTSFCRFFKERTHKQFIWYLNEVRVGHACRLLLERKLTISQVAYASGYENISNFNKQFKKIKKTTPSLFIKDYFDNH